MRRFLLSVATALFAAAPLGAAPARGTQARHPFAQQPIFGPSIHLSDPSRYPADDPTYARQPLPDDEPSVAIAPDGTVWVAALHMHHGTALWRGVVGRTPPAFVGMPDGGIGGDDVALALGTAAPSTSRMLALATGAPVTDTVATRRNVLPPANLYVAALAPITTPGTAWRIAATACPQSIVARAFSSCTFYPHLAYGRRDRPWLAAYGRSTVYLSYVTRDEDLLTGQMTVQRSDDAGATWRVVGDPVAALAASSARPLHGWPGNLVVDQRTGTVYEIFVTATPGHDDGDAFNRLVVARSHDGGLTWQDALVYHGATGEDDGNMWPGLAADASGQLYAVWSNRRHVLLSSSSDGGVTWTPARQVDAATPGLRSDVLPSVAAGASGHVGVAWYGSAGGDNLAPTARWRVYYASSRDGGATFSGAAATTAIHQGPICTRGDACDWIQRQLLDNLGLALDPRTGRAIIAYARSIEFGDYHGCRRAANCPQTYYVEQIAP